MSKVEKRHLTDQVFHACGDVLKAGRREKPNECGRIPEIRVQGESVFVSDHVGIIVGKNRRCKRTETGSRASVVYGSWERGTSAQWTGLAGFLSTSFAKLLLLSAGEHDDEVNLVVILDGFDEFIGVGASMI